MSSRRMPIRQGRDSIRNEAALLIPRTANRRCLRVCRRGLTYQNMASPAEQHIRAETGGRARPHPARNSPHHAAKHGEPSPMPEPPRLQLSRASSRHSSTDNWPSLQRTST